MVGLSNSAYTDSMRRAQHRQAEAGVHQTARAAAAVSRWWSRLLDGDHPWGWFDATVSRYGVRRYRLIVYPPGSSAADRRLARLWRGWPTTGAGLGLLAVMVLGNVVASPDRVLALAVAAYVSVGALLFWRAGPARMQVKAMSAILMPTAADARERARYIEWHAVVHMLTRADQMVRSGAISLLEHEAIWWEAYDRLEAIHV